MGVTVVLFVMVMGNSVGSLAGDLGGWIETVIMRISVVQLTCPAILVAMLIFGVAKGITPIEYRDNLNVWHLQYLWFVGLHQNRQSPYL